MAPLVTTPWNPSMIQNAFNSVQTNGKVPMGPTMTRKAQEAYENRVAYLNELPDSGFDINTIMAPRINQFNQTHDQSAKDYATQLEAFQKTWAPGTKYYNDTKQKYLDAVQNKTLRDSSMGGNPFENQAKFAAEQAAQKEFFEVAGPLFSARIQPGSAILPVNTTKTFRAVGLDRSRRQIEQNLSYEWAIIEGKGQLDKKEGEFVIFSAPDEPALCKLKVAIRQLETVCEAESIITIVDSLLKAPVENNEFSKKGLPGYTLESAAGQMWRSRYDEKRNIIIINSGHRDFIYAGKERMRKLRYISRLFAKELVLHNFVGESPEQLLEHLLELSMYTEDNLK